MKLHLLIGVAGQAQDEVTHSMDKVNQIADEVAQTTDGGSQTMDEVAQTTDGGSQTMDEVDHATDRAEQTKAMDDTIKEMDDWFMDPCIPRTAVVNLVHEILQDVAPQLGPDFSIQTKAIDALHELSEMYVISVMESMFWDIAFGPA
jgi:histone H3/H4